MLTLSFSWGWMWLVVVIGFLTLTGFIVFDGVKQVIDKNRKKDLWRPAVAAVMLAACTAGIAALGATYVSVGLLGVSGMLSVDVYPVAAVVETDYGYAALITVKNKMRAVSLDREKVEAVVSEDGDQRLEPLGINQWRLVYRPPMDVYMLTELRDQPDPVPPLHPKK